MKQGKKERVILTGPILMATLSPSMGSEGLKLVGARWGSSGYRIHFMEGDSSAEAIGSFLEEIRPVLIALSCNSSRALEELERLFLETMIPHSTPVILGGIYATPFLAKEIRKKYHGLTYYSRNLEGAETVLERALRNDPPDPPIEGRGILLSPKGELGGIALRKDLVFFSAPLSLISFTDIPRLGCGDCPGNRDLTCPLAQGYAKEKGLEASRTFINSFSEALLICAPAIGMNHLPEKRHLCLDAWETLLEIEALLKGAWDRVFSYKFPVKCPFCLPEECLMPLGSCRHPDLLRPLHEEFNVDMGTTIHNIAGDRERIEMYSLVLLGE
ncbi:MAG: hypothetical protein JW971_10930 [Synergistales bacterium]|nr:hypothetical protein [Synergistales bacterium]